MSKINGWYPGEGFDFIQLNCGHYLKNSPGKIAIGDEVDCPVCAEIAEARQEGYKKGLLRAWTEVGKLTKSDKTLEASP